MSNPLPRAGAIHRDLAKITEVLARELVNPTRSTPTWSESDWCLARAVASIHGVSPLLSDRLLWQTAPPEWTRFLQQQKAHVAARHVRIKQVLASIDRCAREEHTALIALKGAALHALGIYEAGTRPMADVDLLASEADTDRTARMLVALGYRESEETWHHRVFVPNGQSVPVALGEHSGADIKIELHTRIRERLPLRTVDATDIVFPRHPASGFNPYSSLAALMSHLLLHASGTMINRTLRLLHLHDLAMVARRMSSIDWDEFLTANSARDRDLWWSLPPLVLTEHYFSTIPRRVLERVAQRCPQSLVRACRRYTLSAVSLSNLWIPAFPGIEWTQSTSETLRYIIKRIAPGRQALASRKATLQTNWRLAGSEWGKLSQTRRIVRWMIARPPRVDTMTAVNAVFDQPRSPTQA
jgi:hypothetical protein